MEQDFGIRHRVAAPGAPSIIGHISASVCPRELAKCVRVLAAPLPVHHDHERFGGSSFARRVTVRPSLRRRGQGKVMGCTRFAVTSFSTLASRHAGPQIPAGGRTPRTTPSTATSAPDGRARDLLSFKRMLLSSPCFQ